MKRLFFPFFFLSILFSLNAQNATQYIIQDSVLIATPGGHTLSAVVLRSANSVTPQPVALLFFLYANTERSIKEATYAADHGYVGVVADVRGKRLGTDAAIWPYEHEAEDVYAVIDWISQQSWCNGQVGMYGGSYSGFAQWAGLKHKVHPALKTIVPYVPPVPGMGLPMENNVFLNANYGWAFFVGNNKYLDTATYNNQQRWQDMMNRWYASGVAYSKIDSIDGTPNPWLQRWLEHPGFDAYWQSMIPVGKEFAKIKIPILCIDGYYNDGQVSGMHYLRELSRYNSNADYYVILGPYDHFGAQRGGFKNMRGYDVDSMALINTKALTFEWFDYVMKQGPKPALLKDRVNYEVMGANTWKHAPSLDRMYERKLKFYLSSERAGEKFQLTVNKPAQNKFHQQTVDLADRTTSHDFAYPYPILQDSIYTNGFIFMSAPLEEPLQLNGAFSGQLLATINKRDMDFSVVLYERLPDGTYFELSYYLGRASYTKSQSRRQLLKPGQQETLVFSRTKIISKQLQKGSRLLIVINVNKNRSAEINYGTGKTISQESIRDAGAPLEVKWSNQSFIEIPVSEN